MDWAEERRRDLVVDVAAYRKAERSVKEARMRVARQEAVARNSPDETDGTDGTMDQLEERSNAAATESSEKIC